MAFVPAYLGEGVMKFHTIACGVALGLGLLSGVDASAAPDCDGAECRKAAPAKPLNIMQFMREQAASTRVAEPRRATARAGAKVDRPARRAVAAQTKPANRPLPLPIAASASFASQPAQDTQAQRVQVVASDELNAIDRATGPTPAETMGAAIADGTAVQMVDGEEFNDIDRKAENSPPLSTDAMPQQKAPAPNEQTNSSWLQWIWSAVGSTFTALATAVHHLIG